jgi:hypothetical protein
MTTAANGKKSKAGKKAAKTAAEPKKVPVPTDNGQHGGGAVLVPPPKLTEDEFEAAYQAAIADSFQAPVWPGPPEPEKDEDGHVKPLTARQQLLVERWRAKEFFDLIRYRVDVDLFKRRKPPPDLIRGILAHDELFMLAGPSKVLKSWVAMDAGVSLASGKPFLGVIPVSGAMPVLLVTGETNEYRQEEMFQLVCRSKGITEAFWCQEGFDGKLITGTRLPSLDDEGDVAKMEAGLKRAGIKVVLLDTFYLCFRNAQVGDMAALSVNSIEMANLLIRVIDACRRAGCTLGFLHHFTQGQSRAEDYTKPDLRKIAFAGPQQLIRQWILLNHVQAFDKPNGLGKIWLVCGGSVGLSGAEWIMNTSEGVKDDPDNPPKWEVTLEPVGKAVNDKAKAKAQEKEAAKEVQNKADQKVLLGIVINHPGMFKKQITNLAKGAYSLSKDRAEAALDALIKALGLVKEDDGTRPGPNGALLKCKVYNPAQGATLGSLDDAD